MKRRANCTMLTNRRQQMRTDDLHFSDTGIAASVRCPRRSVIVFRWV